MGCCWSNKDKLNFEIFVQSDSDELDKYLAMDENEYKDFFDIIIESPVIINESMLDTKITEHS